MAVSKVSDLNSLFSKIFEDAVFVAEETNLMVGLVTNYSGSTMADRQMGIYPSLTATTKPEGVDFANATLFDKQVKMTLTPQTKMTQAVLTEERLMTDPDDARRDAAIAMGNAMARLIDQDLLALFSGFSNVKGSAGSALTIKICAAAIAKVRDLHAPNPLNVVLEPSQWFSVWVELGQPTANKAFLGDTANEAMRSYFVGDFLSATWFTSGNITVDASSDAYGAVFNREALAFDTRTPMRLEVEDKDVSLQGWEMSMVARYAVGERRDEFGVAILSDATEPTGF